MNLSCQDIHDLFATQKNKSLPSHFFKQIIYFSSFSSRDNETGSKEVDAKTLLMIQPAHAIFLRIRIFHIRKLWSNYNFCNNFPWNPCQRENVSGARLHFTLDTDLKVFTARFWYFFLLSTYKIFLFARWIFLWKLRLHWKCTDWIQVTQKRRHQHIDRIRVEYFHFIKFRVNSSITSVECVGGWDKIEFTGTVFGSILLENRSNSFKFVNSIKMNDARQFISNRNANLNFGFVWMECACVYFDKMD